MNQLYKILDYYFEEIKNCVEDEKPTEQQIWSMAMIWGAYIGEVMRRELGPDYIWTDEEIFEETTPHIRKSTRALELSLLIKSISD